MEILGFAVVPNLGFDAVRKLGFVTKNENYHFYIADYKRHSKTGISETFMQSRHVCGCARYKNLEVAEPLNQKPYDLGSNSNRKFMFAEALKQKLNVCRMIAHTLGRSCGAIEKHWN